MLVRQSFCMHRCKDVTNATNVRNLDVTSSHDMNQDWNIASPLETFIVVHLPSELFRGRIKTIVYRL